MWLGLDPVPAVWDGDNIGKIGLLCLGVEEAEIGTSYVMSHVNMTINIILCMKTKKLIITL